MKKILELCLENGAEMAEPGEFTKRAFLNGRIDLSQAEAVIDIINAKTNKESEQAVKQLEGGLSRKIDEISKKILSLMADIEASIDYPEYDVEEVTENKAIKELTEIKQKLQELEKTFDEGKIIKEGIKTAIIGKPNAGKSSLLNAILNENRAIVTEYEGTTRDTIEEFINVSGIPLKLIDTAGIRETDNEVEKIGITKSRKIAEEADLIIAIFDGSKELSKEDKEILELAKQKTSIIVINKEDLGKQKLIIETEKIPIVKISALKKTGIEELYREISKLFNLEKIGTDSGELITNIRHKKLINDAIQNIDEAINIINVKMPIDVVSINIKEALENLETITGKHVTEDIIKEIFSKFCLGK